jgi:hypothetical protein
VAADFGIEVEGLKEALKELNDIDNSIKTKLKKENEKSTK